MSDKPAILDALSAVMADVTVVPKSGEMKGFGAKYNFRRWDDLQDTMAVAFRKHGLFLQTETLTCEYTERDTVNKDGKATHWVSCRMRMRYILTSLTDGSTLTFEGFGEGQDSGDKATSKASTMTLKYAMCNAFMVATGDQIDPDAPHPGDDWAAFGEPARPPQPQQQQQQQPSQEQPPRPSDDEQARWFLEQMRIPGIQLARLSQLIGWASERKLMNTNVEGAALGKHFIAVGATIGAQPDQLGFGS